MRRVLLLLIALAWVPAWPRPAGAQASPNGETLAQCLIQSTTQADRKVAVQWAFATMALDPDVASMARVTPAQREAINREAGALVTRLLAQSCREPVQQALLSGGLPAVQSAFAAWGRWAVTGLVAEPHVARGMGALLQYLDIGKLMSLMPLQGLPSAGGTR